LTLSAAEFTDVCQAARLAGLAPGAYAAQAVVAVARQEITALPCDVRTLVLELVQARAELGALRTLLHDTGAFGRPAAAGIGAEDVVTVAAVRLGHMMRRLEEAADALAGRRGFT
jgi:hypothetical protein